MKQSERFANRFQGKTSVINKDGHIGVVSTASRPVQKVNSLINSGLSISNPIKPLNSPSTHSSSELQLISGHSPQEIYTHIGASTASLQKHQTMTERDQTYTSHTNAESINPGRHTVVFRPQPHHYTPLQSISNPSTAEIKSIKVSPPFSHQNQSHSLFIANLPSYPHQSVRQVYRIGSGHHSPTLVSPMDYQESQVVGYRTPAHNSPPSRFSRSPAANISFEYVHSSEHSFVHTPQPGNSLVISERQRQLSPSMEYVSATRQAGMFSLKSRQNKLQREMAGGMRSMSMDPDIEQTTTTMASMQCAGQGQGYQAYETDSTRGGERQQQRYFKLGGLGANVGSQEWKKAKQKNEMASVYSKNVNEFNKKTIQSRSSFKPKKEITVRERGLEFAKKIKRPGLDLNSSQESFQTREEAEALLYKMEELQARHTELETEVARIAAVINN